MKSNSLLFMGCVLTFACVQQLARPKNCTVCNIQRALRAETSPYTISPTQFITVSPAITVQSNSELKTAIANLQAGTTLKIAPGDYDGGHDVRGIDGLTIEALDPADPPRFIGGSNAWHFSSCSNLTLRNLKCQGQSGNGLNIDDGGKLDSAKNIRLEKLKIADIGLQGNHDAIKLSGVDDFVVVECELNGWGGQGIDMVGCHQGTIRKCRLRGKDNSTASAGVQTKGGTADVVVEDCMFVRAGERPLNVGGSTGLDYFRPTDAPYEAARITVRRNRIEGGLCSVAFVGVDGAEFSDNTLLYPTKWVMRILQETKGQRFVPCRQVKVHGNRIAFRRSEVQIECNVGPGTEPGSFEFRANEWYATDRPDRSKPNLPVAETEGKYGVDWTRTID